jgi:fructose-1,6-bisphosphatase/inositol monophosphatase family enzyme
MGHRRGRAAGGREAGGRVTSLDGGPFDLRAGRIVASNGLVHDEMLRVIRTFYATRR